MEVKTFSMQKEQLPQLKEFVESLAVLERLIYPQSRMRATVDDGMSSGDMSGHGSRGIELRDMMDMSLSVPGCCGHFSPSGAALV